MQVLINKFKAYHARYAKEKCYLWEAHIFHQKSGRNENFNFNINFGISSGRFWLMSRTRFISCDKLEFSAESQCGLKWKNGDQDIFTEYNVFEDLQCLPGKHIKINFANPSYGSYVAEFPWH